MKKKALFFFLFFAIFCDAQNFVTGIIKDGVSKIALPFATIKISGGQTIIADADGKFRVNFAGNISLVVSYTGYQKTEIAFDYKQQYQEINLFQESNLLSELKISTDNVALALLKKVISKKSQNNPQLRSKNYEFKSYNKLIVTANPDSISAKIDTIFSLKKIRKIDSTSYKFKKIVTKNHLFEIEKVSLFQFANGKIKETILGTKMAGFKQPLYEVLGFSLQSFSLYDEKYELLGKKFHSPIVLNSIKKYHYKILDTVAVQDRKTVVLYFKSRNKAAPLEGVLYIDIENQGIAKAVFKNRTVLDVSTTYDFDYMKAENLWFPSNTIIKIVKGKNDEDIKILGGTIKFDGDETKNFKKRKREASDFVYAISTTKNFDIEYDVPIVIARKFVKIDIKNNAADQPEKFWRNYRKDSLDGRSLRTYSFLDSLSVKKRIEKRLLFGKKIVNGFVPISNVDLDLRKLINFNNYEGFRLCVALQTNDYFSDKLRLAGYVAYGTKDGNFKYNLSAATRIGKRSSSWIGLAYTDDIQEIASTTFAVENKVVRLFDTRIFNISSFYNYVQWRAFFETKFLPKTESIWEFSTADIIPKFDYGFLNNNQTYSRYNLSTVQMSLKWHPFSDFMQAPDGLLEIKTSYPKFTFQFTKSLPNVLKNDFDFTKMDFKTEYEQQYLDGQLTNLIFSMGFAIGDLPLTHLYNNSPNSLNKSNLLQRTTLVGENDFETMYFNEFFSNQYAFVQFRHEFKTFIISRKIKPNFVLISRAAIGTLSNKPQHIGLDFKTLDDGYLESGVQLNKIFKGLGFGAFYRYGANHLPNFEDNIALRFSYKLDFGF